jgi:hypothetical protein
LFNGNKASLADELIFDELRPIVIKAAPTFLTVTTAPGLGELGSVKVNAEDAWLPIIWSPDTIV